MDLINEHWIYVWCFFVAYFYSPLIFLVARFFLEPGFFFGDIGGFTILRSEKVTRRKLKTLPKYWDKVGDKNVTVLAEKRTFLSIKLRW